MKGLIQDVRFGARMLLKKPGFTLVAVLTLSLGIGANTAIFGLVDKLLVQSLPVREPEALVQVQAESVTPKLTFDAFSWADYRDYRAQNQVFSELTAFAQQPVNLGSGDQMERVRAEMAAENYFEMLGVRPIVGRAFAPEENTTPDAHPVAVLGHSLWQSRFGGDAQVIGRTIAINGASYTIIGVAPARFKGMTLESPTDVWVPAMMKTQLQQMPAANDPWISERGYAVFHLAGRLKPGVTKAAAQTAMDTLAAQVRDSWMPESDRKLPFNEKRIQLISAGQGLSSLRNELGKPLLMLFGVVCSVLLIACANVANLLLARSASRRKEIAVRLALGASRAWLVQQLLVESVLLASAGGGAGLLVAPWLTDLLLFYQTKTDAASAALGHSMNGRVALFTLLVSAATGLLFGLLPALQASKPDLVPALKDDGARRADGAGFKASRRALIVAQVALSVLVLVCAGLFLRSLLKLFAVDPGFKPENVLVAELQLPMNQYDNDRREQFYRRLIERFKALPGVEGATTAAYTPLSGDFLMSTIVVEGQPVKPNEMQTVNANNVGAGYHELLGVRMARGRGFTEADRKGAPGVAVVNEAFARRFFADGNAFGKRISLGTGMPWLEIVGVTRNVKTLVMLDEDTPQLDLPVEQQSFNNPRVLLRTRQDAASLLPAVRREVRALDAGLAFFKTTTIEADLRAQIAVWRMAAALLSLFGAVALALAAIGLYGIIAYSVAIRTREIGIRMALGAQSRDVLRLVMREGIVLTAVGIAIGVAAAMAAMRLIESYLYGVSPTDPATFVAVPLLLGGAALVACWIPARRATKVDPMIALRCE
ncbi:MAG: ABC transporter permease [Blastocatellia bacterium]